MTRTFAERQRFWVLGSAVLGAGSWFRTLNQHAAPRTKNLEPLIAALVTLVLATAAPAEAEPRIDRPVVVRTYNYAQVPDDSLARARAEATAIFERAGISLRWIDCRVLQIEAGAACIEPIDAGRDFVLRLTDRLPRDPAGARRIVALGTSMLDREQGSGVLMTIDLPSIRAVADESQAGMPILLGRAIAHEIGHLLLGSSRHPRAGLMRALWSRDELRGIKPAQWQFSTREAAQMRHGLSLRARPAN